MRAGFPFGRMIAPLAVACATAFPRVREGPVPERLALDMRDGSRHFCFTSRSGAWFYGRAGEDAASAWEGFTVDGVRILQDYSLEIDGAHADRGRAHVTVFPDFIRRRYPGGVVEELRVVEGTPAFVVTVSSSGPVALGIRAYVAGGRRAEEFTTHPDTSSWLAARRILREGDRPEGTPLWTALYAPGSSPIAAPQRAGGAFAPGSLVTPRGRSHIAVFAAGKTPREALGLARRIAADAPRLARRQRQRLERLLASSAVVTGNERFTRALAWAKISLDALTGPGGGIYAGLPWFNNYWGRDTFISLPGAALVTGHFEEARRILSLFSGFQQRDSLSTDYGRIPNIVTQSDTAYNTADGTPRFVMMVREYVERSGDRRFALLMYPVILRSIEGTIRYHTDSLGFLTHGDAETWMDAVGPDGPWSPRGNRANDVQALWAGQIAAGEYFAAMVGDVRSAVRWHELHARLVGNFRRLFLTGGTIADRLKPDGTPERTLRPNQMFTSPLLDEPERARMITRVVTRLTYPWGVASLSQDDTAFHPYHNLPASYPKDAAYHNGTVWTWLQGPLVSLLCGAGAEESAWELTGGTVHQILDGATAGTQSELLDALPRPGAEEPSTSGTFSQAWNLAEFIRNFYDDYLGVRFDGLSRTLTLAPRLPRELGDVSSRLTTAAGPLEIAAGRDGIRLSTAEAADTITLKADLRVSGETFMSLLTRVPPRSRMQIRYEGGTLRITRNGQEWPGQIAGSLRRRALGPGLQPAKPRTAAGLRVLAPPPYPLITHEEIVRTNPEAALIADAVHGPGGETSHYTYPRNSAFVEGAFSLRRFTVAADSARAYFTITFRALADPGWHPEYGFQLTFVAVAIHEDGEPGALAVGKNARVILDSALSYSRIIYVGGGVQVEDAGGRILAAYRPEPADAVRPFGDAASATIRFALPLRVLGEPARGWTCTVLSGAQDDHGGAGLGEFRTVNRDEGQWNGGGKLHPGDPNVYDTLVAHMREVRR